MCDGALLVKLVDKVGEIQGDIGEIKGDVKSVKEKLDDVAVQVQTNTDDIKCLDRYKNYGIGAIVAISTFLNWVFSYFRDELK